MPPSFALLEWLRTFLFTGFPWNPVGYAAMPTPLLMQSVSVVGMVGMNALAVFVFAMPALLAGDRHVRVGLALAVVLVAAHVGFGYFRLGLRRRSADPQPAGPHRPAGNRSGRQARPQHRATRSSARLLNLSRRAARRRPAPSRS